MKRWAGGTLVGLGVLLACWVALFQWHSSTAGRRLVHHYLTAETVTLTNAGHLPSGVVGVLRIPFLKETAPIVEGTSMARLAIGVGHLADSVMPGQPGTSVLAGHNVTWFHRLNLLKVGDTVSVIRGHHRYEFRIVRTAIVRAGMPVVDSRAPTIVLESCYPLNALYFTPDRYLVWAREVGVRASVKAPRVHLGTPFKAGGIPPALQAQGLTLTTNAMPMGHLTVSGTPSRDFVQSNAPLEAAQATTTLFFAGMHTLLQHHLAWGGHLALPASSPLWALVGPRDTIQYLTPADEVVAARGNQVRSTRLAVKVSVTSPTGHRTVMQLIFRGTVQHRHQVRAVSWMEIP